MKENVKYELRPHDADYWTGYFENNLYYEHGIGDSVDLVGRIEGNLFYYAGRAEPAGTIENLKLTRIKDGVTFELKEQQS